MQALELKEQLHGGKKRYNWRANLIVESSTPMSRLEIRQKLQLLCETITWRGALARNSHAISFGYMQSLEVARLLLKGVQVVR